MFKKIFDRFAGHEDESQPAQKAAPAAGPVDVSALHDFADRKDAEKAERRAEIEAAPGAGGGPVVPPDELKGRIEDALRTIYDPEIPVNIYDIGLIYEIAPKDNGLVYIKMTLTSPACPAAGILPGQVESKARGVDGVADVELDLVFDPPWNPEMMSEAARLELGMM
jgi:FeS assembly SUF system protein